MTFSNVYDIFKLFELLNSVQHRVDDDLNDCEIDVKEDDQHPFSPTLSLIAGIL